ncbi:Alpha/Beta hydrolase protein [Dichomitus squalens]|uniref:Alpha/Beta hydrolase protein n=1 Tax=Dichomitus squalens TaxID=114155 RepID=A0A4Q9Q0B4_9APHY|nr:Alpha/Beta hydrolase protein [Dichomitus squalens]TBU60266.1 Alpha/Beta hydrolase protein [Dichomitus squalens]
MASPPEDQKNPAALSILQDSGPPEGSTDYTTVVLLHGFAWHSGIFAKLVPLAHAHNARVVLVNRRDYPGATPFSPEERSLLSAIATESASSPESDAAAADAHAQLEPFMRSRAREVSDLLARLVHDANIPKSQREANKGGLVLVGWSFGTVWMTAFLAHAPALHAGEGEGEVDLTQYLRRVVLLDPPYHVLGFPPPPDPYNPLFDSSIAPADRARAFAHWVSGYFVHHTDALDSTSASPSERERPAAAALERRAYLPSPPPTLSTLTPDEVARALYPSPGAPGGSDALLLAGGMRSGTFATLRDEALAVPADEGLRAVEVRHVWCDRSVWETTWTSWNLRWMFEEARQKSERLREVTWVKLQGANHFVHWDEPERILVALLTDSVEKY